MIDYDEPQPPSTYRFVEVVSALLFVAGLLIPLPMFGNAFSQAPEGWKGWMAALGVAYVVGLVVSLMVVWLVTDIARNCWHIRHKS